MASEVFFTTNPSEWTKLEGLYISERKPTGFIRGADLNDAGIAGQCVRGPTTIQEISGPARFAEVYGGRDYGAGGTIRGEIWRALLNKKFGRLYVRRVVASDATTATVTLDDLAGVGGTNVLTVAASSAGAWAAAGNGLTISIENATSAVSTQFNLKVSYNGTDKVYENLDINGANDNLLTVIGDDAANLIVATKVAPGRPHNQAATALTGGTEGTLAVGQYTTAVTELANVPGPKIVFVAEASPTPATLNGTIVTLAATVTDRVFCVWSGVPGNTAAQDVTAVAAQITTRSDRIIWCFGAGKTIDPSTATKIDTYPHHWMASILTQVDVDVHPGSEETKELLAGISNLNNPSLTRDDLKSLRSAGISSIEALPTSEGGGFKFRSGVTTSLTPFKTEITARRMRDFLTLSAAQRTKEHVKEKNIRIRRMMIEGELTAFCEGLQENDRIVARTDDPEGSGLGFKVDQTTVNTPPEQALGLHRVLWQVRFINHMNHLVLETDMSTGVTIAR